MKCDNCLRYRKSCTGEISYCEESNLRIPMTNADRIRSMTDEELAKFIYEQADCFCQARFGDCIRDEEHCRKAWLKWLKEEVKE